MVDCRECMYYEHTKLISVCWSPGCWNLDENGLVICGILNAFAIKEGYTITENTILVRRYTCFVCGVSYIITNGNEMFECETCCGERMIKDILYRKSDVK